MGYTTDFQGRFDLDKPLKPEHAEYLRKFSETRRMKRDATIAETLPDPIRLAVGLPIGRDGSYFVGGVGFCGQDKDASVLDSNHPPVEQPELWCQWIPTEDEAGTEWDGGEKFYRYAEWLTYLVDHFLTPWGYILTGEVSWQGEDPDDRGTLYAIHNPHATGSHFKTNTVEAIQDEIVK